MQVDAAFFGRVSMADFKQETRKAENDAAQDETNPPVGRAGAVVVALNGNMCEATGAQALGHACGSKAYLVGEIAITDGG